MNYHSITFGDKNTWTDWHLVPTSRPVINPPKPKTQYVDIPGADGSIDLTESLAGRPVFSDREGSIEFLVLNDFNIDGYDYNWVNVYTEVLQYLHGRRMRMVLEDDPDYYYEGRFTVNSWKSDANNSTITIDYVVGPYKYLLNTPLTASDLELGNFVMRGTEGQDDFEIADNSTDLVARLKAPPRPYIAGDVIRVDSAYRFSLALYDMILFKNGVISSSSGVESNSTTRLLTIDYLKNTVESISVKSGYKYAIVGYDSSETYLGFWNGTNFRKASTGAWQTGTVSIATIGQTTYKYKIILTKSNDSKISIEDSTNIIFYDAHGQTIKQVDLVTKPTSKKFVASSDMNGNSYTFEDDGYYRFEIYSMDSYSGVVVTSDDLITMAASVHYYTGGTL